MAGPPDHLEPHGRFTLVGQHGLHPARFADNCAERFFTQIWQRGDQMMNTAA